MSNNKTKILAIIPAREGSKRVPQKNFRPFANTTLLDLAIQQAMDSQLVNKIVVNSDAPQVEKKKKKYKSNNVDFLARPIELAKDESPAIEYMIQTINHYQSKGIFYDWIVIIQASSPLRDGNDIDATIQLLIDNMYGDSAVSVVKLPHMIHPHKLKKMNGAILEPWLVDEGQKTSAHELPDIYVRNCAVYVFKTENLLKGITFGEISLGYVMPEETSVDINDMMDFEFAEYKFVKRL